MFCVQCILVFLRNHCEYFRYCELATKQQLGYAKHLQILMTCTVDILKQSLSKTQI